MRENAFDDFLRRHGRPEGGRTAVMTRLYHAVRNIPYGSTGERDPLQVIVNDVGSCSGKHILLRDLLRASGIDAEVITIFTHFNDGIPLHESMPGPLQALLRGEPVVDFHHYVRTRGEAGWLKLDATWHDPLRAFGFPVNTGWNGDRDTILAATPIREYPADEDIAARKLELLADLDEAQRTRRAAFFRLLTAWIADGRHGRDAAAR